MKKLFLTIASIAMFSAVFAGGFFTNTNQNAYFLRNPGRGASSTDIDAVSSNPAGLSLLQHDGLTISVNNQSAFQTRTATATFAPFAMNGGSATKEYEGKATAPFIPSVQAAYKWKDFVFSGSFAIVGGGGSLKFDNGLPMFEAAVAAPIAQLSSAAGIPTTYSLKMNLEGTSITYGAQLGATYKINEMFSAFIGARASFVGNGYEGYLKNVNIEQSNALTTYFTTAATNARGVAGSLQPAIEGGFGDAPLSALGLPAEQMTQMAGALKLDADVLGAMSVLTVQGAFNSAATQADGAAAGINQVENTELELDTKQSGWGIAPILGLNFNYEKLNIGVKYDFNTNIELKNNTKKDAIVNGQPMFPDKAKSDYDIPALLTIGASYKFLEDKLTASAGYHIFFDKDADYSDGSNRKLDGNLQEFLAGVEYQICDRFLISAGGQITRQGVTDAYLSDLSFTSNSYSIGMGTEIKITEKLSANLAYFFTNYEDYTKNNTFGTGSKTVYSRTNNAFGIGLDYKF